MSQSNRLSSVVSRYTVFDKKINGDAVVLFIQWQEENSALHFTIVFVLGFFFSLMRFAQVDSGQSYFRFLSKSRRRTVSFSLLA